MNQSNNALLHGQKASHAQAKAHSGSDAQQQDTKQLNPDLMKVNSETQLALDNVVDSKTKVQIKPRQFLMEPGKVQGHDDSIPSSIKNILRGGPIKATDLSDGKTRKLQKNSPSKKQKLLKNHQQILKQPGASQDQGSSLLLNSESNKDMSMEGALQQIPNTVPISSPPQTQKIETRVNSAQKLNEIQQDGYSQQSADYLSKTNSQKFEQAHQEIEDILQGNFQSQSVKDQMTASVLSDIHSRHKDSTDLDKIHTRHYQDYIPTGGQGTRSELRTERKPSIFTSGRKSLNPLDNLSNRKTNKIQNEQQLIKHDFTIEEIKSNQFQNLNRLVGPFLTEKPSTDAVQGLESQMKKRVLPHSYESYKKQQRSISPNEYKRQAGGVAIRSMVNNTANVYVKNQENSEDQVALFQKRLQDAQVGRVVDARSQIKVPKDLILMKIAQQQLSQQEQDFRSQRKMKPVNEQSSSSMLTGVNKRRHSLPPLQKDEKRKTLVALDEHLNYNSSTLDIDSIKGGDSRSQIAPQTMRAQSSKRSGLMKLLNQRSDLKGGVSQLNSISALDFNDGQDTMPDTTQQQETNIGFHITDLLKQSTSKAGYNNMKATLDYYKRSMKTDGEINMEKEIIIKNYRLRVVDAKKDITPEDRKLMHKNKGTSIYVANSLIKPEIYRYSTKVSDITADIYLNPKPQPQRQILTTTASGGQQLDQLTFQDSSDITTAIAQQRQTQQKVIVHEMNPHDVPLTPLQNRDEQGNISALGSIQDGANVPSTQNQGRDRLTPFTPHTKSASHGPQRINMTGENSRGVSSGFYIDQADLEAMMSGKIKCEAWINTATAERDRSQEIAASEAYSKLVDDQKRYRLENGQFAPLTTRELAARMSNPYTAHLVQAPRLQANEEMTAVTRFSDNAYGHLMRSITEPHVRKYIEEFMGETAKWINPSTILKSHENPVVQVITYQQQLDAIEFIRWEFTHMDPHLIQDINLSQDLFFEQHLLDELLQLLENRKEGESIWAKTEYMFLGMGGQYELRIIDVEVLSYEQDFRVFVLENNELGVKTTRSRFNLQLDSDPEDFIDANRDLIDYWRDASQQYLRVPRLITAEMLRRYNNHTLSEDMRRQIVFKIGDLSKFDRDVVERVVLQVEALYVFSIMKSTLSSQRNDPFVKSMLNKFHVSVDSPALTIDKQEVLLKHEDLHKGVLQFKFTAIQNELAKSSIATANGKYMQLPILLYDITWKAIYNCKDQMFVAPIPTTLLQHKGEKKFGKLSIRQLELMVNDYPLAHKDWIQGQAVVQREFQKVLQHSWAEHIAKEIWDFISGDFEFDTSRGFNEAQIDMQLLKVFHQIKQYQSTVLYEVFEMGMRQYLRFLLGFALRSEDIKESPIIIQIRNTEQLRLINTDPNFVTTPGTDPNDLELIPLQLNPLVKLHAEIQVSGKMRNRKYKVITVPELDEIQQDFMSVVKNLHDSTQDLKRVDSIVFPLLEVDSKTITQPDIRSNPKLVFVIKILERLLEQCAVGCKRKVQAFQSFISIYEKKPEGIILELKKQSFQLANEGSEDENAVQEEEEEPPAPAPQPSQPESPEPRGSADRSDLVEDEDDEDDSDEEGGGFQGNNMAYKSVDIDENLMRQELSQIRQHRYSIMSEVASTYDFGLLYIDCLPFKQGVIDHCLALETTIADYLKTEFNDKMRNVQSEISALKGRLDDQVTSIDDVIALLEYINSLKRQDNKVEEIADYIEIMAKQMDFILSIQIMFQDDTLTRFYHMRNWPRIFDSWLQGRKAQLQMQKDQLIADMQEEVDEVWETVNDFKKEITELLNKGLRNVPSQKNKERVQMLDELFFNMVPENWKKAIPVEIPREVTFEWFANETNWFQRKFDPPTVIKIHDKLNNLKKKFDDLDKLTIQINKRQQILGIERTDFKEQKKINDELKPLHDLWGVADSFRVLIIEWFEDSLDRLDSQIMENQVEEWGIELKRLLKSPIIATNEKQIEVLNFLSDCLLYVKKYQVLIKTTRVKGLTARHWRQINTELGVSLDPSQVTLLRMIGMKLFTEDKIKIIKGISDIAQKEYAIQMQTEQLFTEMKSVEFEFTVGWSPEIRVIKKIEDVLQKFNEFMLRVQVLKMNPYMRNFFDKLLEIEKTGKQVIEIVTEFQMFQNKWLYLSSIFQSAALTDSLGAELKIWNNVNKFYMQSVKIMHDQTQVVKSLQREGLLTSIRRMNTEIDNCKAGINRFLEQKRQQFPRLYFLSNEELLVIYGNQKEIVQSLVDGSEKSFINTIYQGIIKLNFNKQKQVVSVAAKDGEYLTLNQPVGTNMQVEKWLSNLETVTCYTMKKVCLFAYMDMDLDLPAAPEDLKELKKFKQGDMFRVRKVNPATLKEWISSFPGQATYLCQQLWFQQKMMAVFQGALDKAKQVDILRRNRRHAKQLNAQTSPQGSSGGVSETDEEKSENSDPYDSHDSDEDDDDYDHLAVQQEADLALQSQLSSIHEDQADENLEEPPEGINPDDEDPSNRNESALSLAASDAPAKPKGRSNRVPMYERAMRYHDRFCPNDQQHPDKVLEGVRNGVLNKIKCMITNVNSALKLKDYNSTVALITGCVYQRDQIQHMREKKLYKQTDFEWEIQFKFIIDKLAGVFKQMIYVQDMEKPRPEVEKKLEFPELEIRYEVFNLSKHYGFNYMGNAQRLVITPLTLKAQRSMLVALQFQFACTIEGPFGTGKTETVKDLANNLAKPSYVLNTSSEFQYEEILKFLKGVVASGSWVLLDEFNRMEPHMMNYITQILTQIQTAVRGQVRMIFIDEQKVSLDFESAIFITMNPGYAGRAELPVNLKEIFRPIQMVVPDWSLIAEILLSRAGFVKAHELSRKMTHIQKQANELMSRHSHVRQDFGLRAIRAIIHIAECLKRQAQNLQNSEMPDMIHEHVMAKLAWKDTKMINDVIAELNSVDDSQNVFGSQKIFFGSPSRSSIKLQASQANINIQSTDSIVQQQLRSSTELIAEALNDNTDLQQAANRFLGSFFDQAFRSDFDRKQKQIKCLYQQIGLDKANPTEEELEEQIIIKAMNDFNTAKFADQDHQMINSIIADVFPQSVPEKIVRKNSTQIIKGEGSMDDDQNLKNKESSISDVQGSDYGNLKELLAQYMQNNKLEYNPRFENKCYQMFEVLTAKTGCILLGESQSSKSTLIDTLSGALNYASYNELKLRIAQIRREKLITMALASPQINLLLTQAQVKKLSKTIKQAQRTVAGQSAAGETFKSSMTAGQSQQSVEQLAQSKETQSGFQPTKSKKAKLSEKQKTAIWADFYKQTKLDRLEVFALEEELVLKGVNIKRINPKSISRAEFIGEVVEKSGIWSEGLLTITLREFSEDTSLQKKWIHLDGPIDHDWAENLNSILDDNKKMNLPNGDAVRVNPLTNIIFECESIKNLTPATISRCGLVHMNRPAVNNPKYIFNNYLLRISQNLNDYVKEIEQQANWLMPTCFKLFNEEKERGTLLVQSLDTFWMMQSFLKIYDSFMTSYWIDFIGSNKSDWEDKPQQEALRHCIDASGYPERPFDIMRIVQEDSYKLDPEVLEAEFKAMKIKSARSDNDPHVEQRIAYNDYVMNDNRLENSLKFIPIWLEAFLMISISMTFGPVFTQQARTELSRRLKEKYLQQKGDFTTYQKIKKKIQAAREEQKKKEQKAMLKAMMTGKSKAGTSVMNDTQLTNADQTLKHTQKSNSSVMAGTHNESQSNLAFNVHTLAQAAGLTTEFQEATDDLYKPMFISDFPFENDYGLNMFDYYFNLDNNQWTRFDNLNAQTRMTQQFNALPYSQQCVNDLSIPTMQWLKNFYLMECLVMAQKPVLIAGQRATGKSTIVKDLIFNQTSLYTNCVLADHITCTQRTDNNYLKEHISRQLHTLGLKLVTFQEQGKDDDANDDDSDTEKPLKSVITKENQDDERPETPDEERKTKNLIFKLQKKLLEDQGPKIMKPPGDQVSLLVYLEDLHLTQYDSFRDNTTAETIRDLICYKQWYSTHKQSLRKVQGVNLITCMNTGEIASQNDLSLRLLRQFTVIGLELLDQENCFSILNKMVDLHAQQWPSTIQQRSPNIARAIHDLYTNVSRQLRPTPIKVQYTFNQREMFKTVAALVKVESNYPKSPELLTKLFVHEAVRQYGDRILMTHDYKWFVNCLKAICCKHFFDKDVSSYDFTKILHGDEYDDHPLFENFPVKEPHNLWFSVLNDEVEGYYLESNQPKKIRDIIERLMSKYNEQPETRKLNLVLFDELYRHMFKIVRALNIHGSNLIVVGLRGFATGELIKLASYIAARQYATLEMHPDFTDQDWKQELRHKIMMAGQDSKPVCFVLEEYRMTNPDWYRDVEAMMTCNTLSSVFLQSDIPAILSALRLQHRRVDRFQITSHVEPDLKIDGSKIVQDEKQSKSKKDSPEKEKKHISLSTLVKENVRIIQSNPNLFNDMYKSLLNRIKKNLRFVLQFTPSGQNFRDKMQAHSQLMHNSQIMWVQHLQSEDLVQIGEQVFVEKMEQELKEKQMADTDRDPRLDEHNITTAREHNTRIMLAFVEVYQLAIRFAQKYQEKNHHSLYFTPVFFLRSMQVYKRLLIERSRSVDEIQKRYANGLDKLKSTLVLVQDYQRELEKKTPTLIAEQEKLVALVVDIQAQIDSLDQKRSNALSEEVNTTSITDDMKKQLDDAQYAIDSIIPALNNSMAQMQKVTKQECADIRSMQHPPRLVKLVMKAICILLDIEPLPKVTKQGTTKLSYWRAAIGPNCLADPNLPDRLESFDRANLSFEKMDIVEELMSDPDYSHQQIKKASFSAENLYGWVKALRDYYYIFKELEPRKAALQKAELDYQKATQKSGNKRNQIQNFEEGLQELTDLINDKKSMAENLGKEIADQIKRKRRADTLLRSLHSEKQKWVVVQRMVDANTKAVGGDVVLAAAIVNYAGGFSFSFRRQLIEKWQSQALKPQYLTTSQNFQLQELFGDNFKIRDWHAHGLSKDILSTDNALIMDLTNLYIAVIDPQQQAQLWLKQQYAQEGMLTTKLTDPNFKRTLEVAIDMGKLVIVEDVPEKIDIHLESLVKQEITRYQDTRMIKFCRKQLKLDPGFKVIIVTNLPSPHYDVNLTNYVTLINFYMTVEGLCQNLLSLVVANERKDLEDEFNKAMDITFSSVKSLKSIENKLLEKLENETVQEILQDDTCIELLKESGNMSEGISTNLRKIQQTNEFLDKSRAVYTPVAFRAAQMFYGILELHRVNPMYKFGLKWFLNQFSKVMILVNKLVSPKAGKVTSSQSSVIQPVHKVTIENEEFVIQDVKMSPDYRVDLLIKTFTQEIIRKVIFSVFQEDRQFITYFLTIRIVQAEQLSDNNLLSFAMAGSKYVTQPQKAFQAQNNLTWLSDVVWSDLSYLESLKPFNQNNLTVHILENQEKWHKIYLGSHISFEKLPNRALIDLDQFKIIDIRDAIEAQDDKLKVTVNDEQAFKDAADDQSSQKKSVSKDPSRAPSATGKGNYTEAEILNDEALWAISEDEDDDNQGNRIKLNKEFYSTEDATDAEEKVMARFMAEHAPGSIFANKDFNQLHVMTKKERRLYELRQNVLRKTVELAVAKCIRPDLMQSCLHQLVSTIYDFGYTSFDIDVLNKFIDFDGTLRYRQKMGTGNMDSFISAPKRGKSDNNIQLLIQEAFGDSSSTMPILFLVSHSVNVSGELQAFHSSLHQQMKLTMVQCSKSAEAQFQQQIKTAMMNGDWILVQNLHMEPTWIDMVEEFIQQLNSETNPRFRLWLTIPQQDDCNDFLLKSCIKVALQQPINIKMKIERHLQNVKESLFRRYGEIGTVHKNIFLGLCYLHGVLDGRRQFGPLGWNVEYEFDQNDFDISDQLLTLYLKKDLTQKYEQLEVMKYIFSQINFAGKISRSEDERKLQAHVQDLFNEDLTFMLEAPSDLDASHMGFPEKETHMVPWAQQNLPEQDDYRIFGFNDNINRYVQKQRALKITNKLKVLNQPTLQELGYADVHTDLQNQSRRFELEQRGAGHQSSSILEDLIQLQTALQNSSLDQSLKTDQDRYDERISKSILPLRDQNDRKAAAIVTQIRDKLRDILTNKLVEESKDEPPSASQITINYCLQKELKSFKELRDVMIDTFDSFLAQVAGLGVIPPQTEQLWLRIQNNQIPQTWLEASYDTARLSLAHYMSDFITKARFWDEMIKTDFKAPAIMITAFFDPRQFYIAKTQEYARINGLNVRNLKSRILVTQFLHLDQAIEHFSAQIKEGEITLLHGLYLEGADWDPQTQMLVEQNHYRMHNRFPVLELTQFEQEIEVTYDENDHTFDDNPELTKQERKDKEKRKLEEELAKRQIRPIGGSKTVSGSATPKVSGGQTPKSGFPGNKQPLNMSAAVASHEQSIMKQNEQKRTYVYKCPVFATTNRLSLGGVGQENKPLFYVELNSKEKPGKWVKRSVALLMEPAVLDY